MAKKFGNFEKKKSDFFGIFSQKKSRFPIFLGVPPKKIRNFHRKKSNFSQRKKNVEKVGGTPDYFKKIEGTPEKMSFIHNIRHNMLKMLFGQKRGISPNPLDRGFQKSTRGFGEISRFSQI